VQTAISFLRDELVSTGAVELEELWDQRAATSRSPTLDRSLSNVEHRIDLPTAAQLWRAIFQRARSFDILDMR